MSNRRKLKVDDSPSGLLFDKPDDDPEVLDIDESVLDLDKMCD